MEAVAPQWQVFGVAEFLPELVFQCTPQLFPIAAFDVGRGTWLFFRSWIVREGCKKPLPLDDLPHFLGLFPGGEPPPASVTHGYLPPL